MNKSELIDILSERGKMTRKRAEDVINMIFDSMMDVLKNGDRIEIRGFGSFEVRDYGSYTGRNPRTGQSIRVKPKKLPFFKVGKELRQRVDGKPFTAEDSEDHGSHDSDDTEDKN